MNTAMDQRFVYVPIQALILSIALHIGLMVFSIGYRVSGLWSDNPPAKKSLYQDFIQVDVVALPDELPNQMPAIDTSKQVAELPKFIESIKPPVLTDVMVIPKETTQSVKDQTKKRQADQDRALKELEEEARREQALKNLARSNKEGRAQLKGNILAKGNTRTGEQGTSKDVYDARVRRAIKEHFNVYAWQQNKALVTVVHIGLFSTGRVRKKSVITSSNDPLYDAAVLQAIDQAQPLPIPADLSLIANGITVEFKPTE